MGAGEGRTEPTDELSTTVAGVTEISVDAVSIELASGVVTEVEPTAGLSGNEVTTSEMLAAGAIVEVVIWRGTDVSMTPGGELVDKKTTAGVVDDVKPQLYTVTVVILWIVELEASAPHPLAVRVISTHFFCPMTGVV